MQSSDKKDLRPSNEHKGSKDMDKNMFLFNFQHLNSRSKASHGLWLIGLLPLSCYPGFHVLQSNCQSSIMSSLLSIQVGISSLIILQIICNDVNKSGTITISETLRKSLFQYVPLVINFFAILYFSETNFAIAAGCVSLCYYLQLTLTKWIFTHFGKSFSIGEGLLVGQAAALSITLSLKGLIKMPSSSASEFQHVTNFVEVAVITCSICSFILWKNRTRMKCSSLIALLFVMGCFGLSASSFVLGVWSLSWIVHTISSSSLRIALFGWWANISVLIVLTAIFMKRLRNIPQTIMRKMFHILIVFIFAPGIILDPTLTFMTSSGAMLLFLLLELIRFCRIKPFGKMLDNVFALFLDEKDGGPCVLSHIYLLAGLSCTLWLYPCSFPTLKLTHKSKLLLHPALDQIHVSALPLLAGVLAVGIGDTAASIGGTYWGNHKWPGTKKSVEGTFCAILCQVVFVVLLVLIGVLNISMNSCPKIIISIFISSTVEAFTDQVDNIVLPLILYTPLMDS